LWLVGWNAAGRVAQKHTVATVCALNHTVNLWVVLYCRYQDVCGKCMVYITLVWCTGSNQNWEYDSRK